MPAVCYPPDGASCVMESIGRVMLPFSVKRPVCRASRRSETLPSVVVFFILCAISLRVFAAPTNAFRWVDESGVVHYTDQIPPSQVDRGHEKLSDQGVRVEVVPPSQSLDEIQRERELERLRAQQDRLIEQQKAADRVLLRTFRSIDDLLMARDGKLAAIDVVIQVARGNIRRQQEWLRNLRAEAADMERAGKPVPQHVTEGIGKSERYIRDSYATIVDREQQKAAVRQDFDRDLKRFRKLKDIPEERVAPAAEPLKQPLRNLVTCEDTAQCDQYWVRALAYAQSHATTQIQTSGANILITAPPETLDDFSLTLSRVQEKEGQATSIFLDMQCKNPTPTDVSCNNARAMKVLDEFHDAVIMPTSKPDAAGLRAGAAK